MQQFAFALNMGLVWANRGKGEEDQKVEHDKEKTSQEGVGKVLCYHPYLVFLLLF